MQSELAGRKLQEAHSPDNGDDSTGSRIGQPSAIRARSCLSHTDAAEPNQFSRALHAKLPDPSSSLFVAEHEGRLVGYVSGYSHPTFYASGPTAWVDELLSEPLRGTGIGRQLMDAFELWAQARRCVMVSLATRSAAAFYEHRGYRSKAGYYKRYFGTVPSR